MRDFFRRLLSYKPTRRSQGGWAVAVPAAVSLASSIFGKNAAKKAATSAADQQTQLANQAQGQYANQQAGMRNAVLGMASGPNPYQQAASAMSPYFSAPGSDVAQFGPQTPFGWQATPVQGNPTFTPQIGMTPAPSGGPIMSPMGGAPPQAGVPAGWTNYGLPGQGGGGTGKMSA